MIIETTPVRDVLLVTPKKHGDERGFFSETYKRSQMAEHGVSLAWVQDNHCMSSKRGTVRGLHFQAPPRAQAKLIRVVAGAIFDVVVDIRKGSSTYGQHFAVELSSANWRQLFVPAGMAHGYCTLTDHAEVLYKVSEEYDPALEGGLLWSDPALGIGWPFSVSHATSSSRDALWPTLEELVSPF